MTGYNPFKFLGITCLAAFLLAAPQLYAQDTVDDFGGLDDLSTQAGSAPANVESPAAGGVSDSTVSETPDAGLGDGMTAESPSTGGDAAAADGPKLTEQEQVDALINKFTFATENPKKDPFRPIVEKKVVLPPVRPVQPTSKPSETKPALPPVKPIRLFVTGIVGNEGNRLAVVKFENNELTVIKDQIVEGKFKVVDILSDRVVIYSNKEQRRHTFKIDVDEKD
ncbi:MAG TPA: hypothetical protein PLM07_04730 [Candidatus Rifleibacterium sp.]|nr:hypothetical protein [Candidatus Rifleibacterium sp.]HPT45189.1 hypothetical protein [Candidatus Rifleibacterium sp.]